MRSKQPPLNGQRIGLFGRGGSGKSTTTVFLARALRKSGYPVCVLDADSTNEGLARALGVDRAPDSLLEWMGGTVFSGGPVTCPVDDPVPLAMASVSLNDLPARFYSRSPNGCLLFQAGKIGPLGPGAGCDGPMTKIARDFVVQSDGPRPVTLLDFKAGLEDAARGVVTSLDWVVMVIDPTYTGIQAAATLRTLLDQMHAGQMPATRHLQTPELIRITEEAYRNSRLQGAVFVLNKVSDPQAEHQLWQLLVQDGIQPVAAIPDDPALRQAWLDGLPLLSPAAQAEASKIVRALEEGRGRFEAADHQVAAAPLTG